MSLHFLASDDPNKIALRYQGGTLTYGALSADVKVMAKQLSNIPSGILALTATPHSAFIVQLLAAFHNAQPVAIFAPHCPEAEKQSLCERLGRVSFINESGELILTQNNATTKHHPQTALILFTSGSTGLAKAVQLSEVNIKANCQAVIRALDFRKARDQLLFLPLSYSFGLLGQLLPGLAVGLTTELITNFTDIKSIFESGRVPQMWSGVPSHWFAINKMAVGFEEAASKITHVIAAGAPLNTVTRAHLAHTFPNARLFNNYGLTEASPRVLVLSSDDPNFLSEAVGYPIGDWQIKLNDEGELLIRGTQVMLGYLGEGENNKIQDGWLSTGDIAELSPNNLVTIKGRMDHIVNIAGEKVNLIEIEQAITKAPHVTNAAVIPVDDPLYGIRLVAFVVSDKLSIENLRQSFHTRKLPILIHLLPILPTSKQGKLDRIALKSMAEAVIKKDTSHAD